MVFTDVCLGFCLFGWELQHSRCQLFFWIFCWMNLLDSSERFVARVVLCMCMKMIQYLNTHSSRWNTENLCWCRINWLFICNNPWFTIQMYFSASSTTTQNDNRFHSHTASSLVASFYSPNGFCSFVRASKSGINKRWRHIDLILPQHTRAHISC